MPYIYSCARQVTETGRPIMRAMCIDFADDPTAAAQETQFMFGPALLVAPVLEAGARRRRLYLPKGRWYDFWSDQPLVGGQWIEVDASLSRIPLFVRAGSVIPMGAAVQHAAEQPLEQVEVHIYPDQAGPGMCGSFDLYEDDGLTYAYEQGKYALTRLSVDADGQVTAAALHAAERIIPIGRRYVTVSHDVSKQEPLSVTVDYDLAGSGVCSVHALVSLTGEAVLKAVWTKLPQGWALKKGALTNEITCRDGAHLTWELVPSAEALPLFHEGMLDFTITQAGKAAHLTRKIRWGSGYATRWSVVGHFANPDGQGLENRLLVEENPNLPEYLDGERRLAWQRIPAAEFNCFGYVDLRQAAGSELRDGRGVAYARGRIWSSAPVSARLELSAEPCIKVWLNQELVYQSLEVLLKQVLPQSVNLQAGWNDVLVKVAIACERPFGGREFGFNFRLVDKQGKPLGTLLYSA
jgi:hypothetical protein